MNYFEWDDNKYNENLQKHGVRFEDAVVIFSDSLAIEIQEIHKSEDRFIRIGINPVKGVLVVVYCERGVSTIRIISARKATKKEEGVYEKGI